MKYWIGCVSKIRFFFKIVANPIQQQIKKILKISIPLKKKSKKPEFTSQKTGKRWLHLTTTSIVVIFTL